MAIISIVLISGVSGSGKSTIAKQVADQLPNSHLFQQDHYFTKPFLPYVEREDASYEDGTGIDWEKLQRDMEASVVGKETKSYILVEGHMLGAACAMFLKCNSEGLSPTSE